MATDYKDYLAMHDPQLTAQFGNRRDLLVTWLVTVAAGLAIGFLLCLAAFGADFLAGLATPRAWSAHNAVVKLTQWPPPVVLIALGLLFRPARDLAGMCLGLFAALAVATACLGTAGDGVVYRAPDSWIALAIAAVVAWSVALTAVAMIAPALCEDGPASHSRSTPSTTRSRSAPAGATSARCWRGSNKAGSVRSS